MRRSLRAAAALALVPLVVAPTVAPTVATGVATGAATGAVHDEATGADPLAVARLEARLDKLVLEFAAAGFALERESLELAALPPDAWTAALGGPDASLRARDDNPGAWLLRGAHVKVAENVAGLRAEALAGLAAGIALRYDPASGRLVVPETALADALRDERALAHELARLWLDRRFDLARLGERAGEPLTLERAERAAGLAEGLADAVALEVLLARGERTLADLTEQQAADTLARLASAPGPLARYKAGRSFAVLGVRADGRAFLEGAFDAPPPSTEALIHAAKRGQDAPLAVELVDWPDDWDPVPLVVDDVVGEQGLYDALLDAGLAPPAAWRAAAGWDGDRIRLWSSEREALWAWRIVCDRDVDASQLVSAWSRFECRVRRTGRAFTCVLGTDAEHVEAMLDRLAALPTPDADPLDAASAELVEGDMPALSAEPRVEDGRWLVPSLGLSFPAPDGWRAQKMSGTPYLFAPVRTGNFIDNVNARSFDDPSGGDLARIESENRAGIQGMPGLVLEACEVIELERLGQRALWMSYAGAMGGNELLFRALVIPRAGKLITVTATLLAANAETGMPAIERALLEVAEL